MKKYEYGIITGIKNVHFAPLIRDDETGTDYEAPFKICDTITIKPSFEFYEGQLNADNKMIRNDAELTGIRLQIESTRFSPSVHAKILGHKLDANGGLLIEDNDVQPEGALLYQVTLDNGKSKYVVIYKGAFRDFPEEAQTERRGSKDYQTPTIEYSGYRRADGKLRYEISEEVPWYNDSVIKQWFAAVQEPVEEERNDL